MRGYPKSLSQAGLWRAGVLVKLVEGGEVLVAKEELGGGVIVLLQIANKKEALGVVVVEGEQAAEVVVLLHVDVDKGEGGLNFETGVLQ